MLTEETGKYAGIVLLPEIYSTSQPQDDDEPLTLASFARYKNDVLLGTMNAKQAAQMFDRLEAEALAVVNNQIERRVIGLLTESHTLRRYSEELDRRRREESGEI